MDDKDFEGNEWVCHENTFSWWAQIIANCPLR